MTTIQCPKCPQSFDAKFAKIAEQHATWHAGIERRNAERVASDAAVTAAYGPSKRVAELFTAAENENWLGI